MKAKEYPILEMAVSSGVMLGMNRAHKHSENPSQDMIREKIIEAVMSEICEWFDLDAMDDNRGHH